MASGGVRYYRSGKMVTREHCGTVTPYDVIPGAAAKNLSKGRQFKMLYINEDGILKDVQVVHKKAKKKGTKSENCRTKQKAKK